MQLFATEKNQSLLPAGEVFPGKPKVEFARLCFMGAEILSEHRVTCKFSWETMLLQECDFSKKKKSAVWPQIKFCGFC